MRVALEAILDGSGTDTELDGWKLFVLAPRMLLFRAPGTARVPLAELTRRERLFCEGKWVQLLVESAAAARESTVEASAALLMGQPTTFDIGLTERLPSPTWASSPPRPKP